MTCESHETDQDEGSDDCEACELGREAERWSTRAAVAERELAAERARWAALKEWIRAGVRMRYTQNLEREMKRLEEQ